MEKRDEDSKPVSNFIFWSIVTLMFVIMGYLFTEVNKVQSAQQIETASNNSVLVQLSQIQTDLAWIKEKLSLQK